MPTILFIGRMNYPPSDWVKHSSTHQTLCHAHTDLPSTLNFVRQHRHDIIVVDKNEQAAFNGSGIMNKLQAKTRSKIVQYVNAGHLLSVLDGANEQGSEPVSKELSESEINQNGYVFCPHTSSAGRKCNTPLYFAGKKPDETVDCQVCGKKFRLVLPKGAVKTAALNEFGDMRCSICTLILRAFAVHSPKLITHCCVMHYVTPYYR